MTARLTTDNNFILLENVTPPEREQLVLSLTKKIKNWFIIKQKNKGAIVDEAFINEYNMIPKGLWLELVNICKTYGFPLEFVDDFNCKICDCSITPESFTSWRDEWFRESGDFKPYDYQEEGAFHILQYKNCCCEISTSAGKTLIGYMLFHYLRTMQGVKHFLYVTPSTDLTKQSEEKFEKYDGFCNRENDWTHIELYSGSKIKKGENFDEDIIFANYQSLAHKKSDFFEKFDAVYIDEGQHARADSIKNVIKKCINARYRVGVTGTFPKDEYDSLTIQSFIGPVVYRYNSEELIDSGRATPVWCYGVLMDYLDTNQKLALRQLREFVTEDNPEYGGKVLEAEKEAARNSNLRFNYICKTAAKTTKNTLIMFTDVKGGYGRKIYDWLKENTDKNVFYVDGTITSQYRDYAKKSMEDDETGNTIIVASMGTFGEGIDICNLWNIFLVETTKSDNQMGQILGRGMRKYPGKDKVILLDFGDDFRITTGDRKMDRKKTANYLYRHFECRQEIYAQRGFPYKLTQVNLYDGEALF